MASFIKKGFQECLEGEPEKIEPLFAKNFVDIDENGGEHSRSEVLNMVTAMKGMFESMTFEDLKVFIFGGTAVVNYRQLAAIRGSNGQVQRMDDNVTEILVRQAGRWTWVLSKMTARDSEGGNAARAEGEE